MRIIPTACLGVASLLAVAPALGAPRAAAPAKGAPAFTRDPAGACALRLARSVALNSSQSAAELAYAITQKCLGDEPLAPTCALDVKSPCEVRDDAKFQLLQQLTYKLVEMIRLDDVIARSPK